MHGLISLNHSPYATTALSNPISPESFQKSLEAKFSGGKQGPIPVKKLKKRMGVSVCCIHTLQQEAARLVIATQPPMINNNDRTSPHYQQLYMCIYIYAYTDNIYHTLIRTYLPGSTKPVPLMPVGHALMLCVISDFCPVHSGSV